VAIGADKQVVDVLIDTGSFELWVNPDCKSSNVAEFCNGFGHYNPLTSKTSKKGNQGFSIAYGSGKASGLYYKDDIYISGESAVLFRSIPPGSSIKICLPAGFDESC